MGFRRRLAWVAVLLAGWAVGCGSDDKASRIRVTVDGMGLPPDALARIAVICVRVEGDLEQFETCYPVPPGAFDDGRYEFDYVPKNKSGVVSIVVTAKDKDGNLVAANQVDAEIIPGANTPATVSLSGMSPVALLVAEPASLDFGTLVLGAPAGRATMMVRNAGGALSGPLSAVIAGDAAFVIDSATSCDGRALAPAESCMLALEYRPGGAGPSSGRLEITATPGGVVTTTLAGSALAPAQLVASPDVVDLGAVEINTTGTPILVTVLNTGGVASGTLSATLGGTSAAEVTMGSDACSGVSVAPGAMCMITLMFRPTTAGAKAAMLTVSGTPGGDQVVMLAGRGLAGAALGINPSGQDFGTTVTNNIANATFTVRNAGEVNSGTLAVSIEGQNMSEFAIAQDTCVGVMLGFNATCVVTVRFQPTTVGAKTALVRVRGTPGGNVTATLTGNAVPPGALAIMPASIDFGGVLVGGMSATQAYTVRNTGGAPTGLLTVSLSGTSASQFATIADGCNGQSLAASATCTVSFQLRPTTAGNKTASLAVVGNPGGTATAALMGTGLAPARLSANATNAAMGTVDVGFVGSTFVWTVSNVGDVTSGTLATSVTGNSADFQVSGNCNTTLGPAASCQVSVTLAPATGGAKSITVTVSGTPGGSVALLASGTARPPQVLSVTRNGNGAGTVASSPVGLSCGSTCSQGFRYGTAVTLTPTPSTGSSFTGWAGACTGTGSCLVNMTAAQSVTATFTLQRFNLGVTTSGVATGTVSSNTGGINCGPTCSAMYDYNTVVMLTAMPAPNYGFGGWSGACAGTATTCSVTMSAARSVSATFTLNQFALSVSVTGSGRVASSPAGIDCGSDCGEAYNAGQVVQLTASASTGYSFGGWTVASGTCTGMTSPCNVTMSAARSVTARFDPIPQTITVVRVGKGTGTVSSSPAGINCGGGGVCAAGFPYGMPVVLTATPATGHEIRGWSGGGCSGTATTCTVTPTAATTVQVQFERQIHRLTVNKRGFYAVNGTVNANIGMLSCGTACSDNYAYGDTIVLTEIPGNATFTGWSGGGCSGTGTTCTIVMGTADINAYAWFETASRLSVSLSGGFARITSLPAGIDCPQTACQHTFMTGDKIRLTVTQQPGYTFQSWTGACAGEGLICNIILNNTVVSTTAVFSKP